MIVPPLARTARCPYCDSPAVVDRPASTDRPDPVFGIGFALSKHDAIARMRAFLSGKRWAPSSLRHATADRVEGVYVPAYLYTAVADSTYRAEIGEDYWVTRYDASKKRIRRDKKTEYRELAGVHHCYVSDILVTASKGLDNDELEGVEPFEPAGLRAFAPGLVAGWTAEEPSMTRDECLELARAEARARVDGELRAFMPGDSCRNLRSSTDLRDEAADLVVVPVWIGATRSRPDREPVRILVNGQTGKASGKVPLSWAKIGGVIAAVVSLIALAMVIGRLL